MQAHADPPDVDDLLDAVEAGNVDRVRELLDGGDVGVNDADGGGWTALHGAAAGGDVALVNMFIKSGATVDQAKENGATPLYVASQNGRLEVVKALIEAKAKVNQAMEDGCTPLCIASQRGKLEVVKALIKAKAKVNQAKENGCTPIYTASHNDHPLVVQVLIDAGARSAEPVFDGFSPLHAATKKGHMACVKVLTGFRPDTPGWATFLAGATSKKELEASLAPPGERPPSYLPKIFDRAYLEPTWKFQRERYSDLHLKDNEGQTALDMAVANKKTDVAKLLRDRQLSMEKKAVKPSCSMEEADCQ